MNINFQDIWTTTRGIVLNYGLKILLALVILIVGRWVIKLIIRSLRKFFKKRNVEPTLTSFGLNIIYGTLMAFVIIAALGQVGIQTTSFVAILGAAGLAVGFALQGSLASFAAGVLIILLRPFKIGDFIEAGGATGTVKDIGIFSSTLKTPDNKIVIVPNTNIMGGNITNYNFEDKRRIDLVIGVGYDDDIRQVEQLLKSILESEERILPEPASTIGVLELADSSVNFAVRPWVNTSDYWPVYFDLLKNIKLTLDANGITIPYPQQDVYLHQITEDK